MTDLTEAKNILLETVKEIQHKNDLSKTVGLDYFEPGMMENLDQYAGIYDSESDTIIIKTEVKGLRYENRTQRLNSLNVGDALEIVRDEMNPYNRNNFNVQNSKGENMGTLPAELCNALAPLFDTGYAYVTEASVSYIEKLLERSRYAKQGVLFAELHIQLRRI